MNSQQRQRPLEPFNEGFEPSASNRGPPGKGARAPRFRPRKAALPADFPTRQPPVQRTARPPRDVEEALRPKHLSTVPTPPKNDPCELDEVFVNGLAGMAFRSKKLKFSVDFSGYMDLSDQVYNKIAGLDRYWQRSITPAMWNYYTVTMLWMRIFKIREQQGYDNTQLASRLRNALPDTIILPKPLMVYLQSLGDILDPNQRHWEIELPIDLVHQPVVQNRLPFRGSYGQPTADTHWMYSTRPAPALSIVRLGFEIASRDNAFPDPLRTSWQAQGVMNPAIGTNAVHPTKNMLGWDRVSPPHSDALRELDLMGITGVSTPAGVLTMQVPGIQHFDNFPLLSTLINWVSTKMSTIQGYPMDTNFPETRMGSTVQEGFCSYVNIPAQPDPMVRWTTGQVCAFSAHQLSAKVGIAVALQRMRLDRPAEDDPSTPSTMGYLFLDDEPPEDWVATNNTLILRGDQDRWNIPDFTLPEVNGRDVTQGYIDNFARKT